MIDEVTQKLRRNEPVVMAGRSSNKLAEEIAWGLGGYIHPVKIERYADGEIGVELEASVRGRHVFIVQTMALPLHESLMELLLLVDACRRASAGEISLVIPYLAYSRQDRKARPRSAISAKVVARMLETVGADRVITFDLHSGQVQGFYEIPCDNLPAATVLAPAVKKALLGDDVCIVATDVNGLHRARNFARYLVESGDEELPLAVIDKRKARAGAGPEAIMGPVEGRHCILVDDMIGTAGTLLDAANALRAANARAVSAVVTHGIFSGDAVRKLAGAGFQKLWLTDTLPISDDVRGLRGVEVVTIATLMVMVIRRICEGDSLEEVYG